MIRAEEQATNDTAVIALDENQTVIIDLPTLIETRAIIQANSGGGKSWAIRRILEQSHGKVQQIVIDVEGSFRTLREQFEYFLLGAPTNCNFWICIAADDQKCGFCIAALSTLQCIS
jgi:hypothetical protein